MTYRAKPVVRSRRAAWESPQRRNLLLNLGFGLVVALAILLLAAAAALIWYGENLAPVASVNGQNITTSEYNRRLEVERIRLSIAQSRIADEQNAGRLTDEQAELQNQFIGQRLQQLPSATLERLIDVRIQEQLAAEQGIQVTEAEVDAKLTEEATRPEQRRAWVIEVEPEVEEGAPEPTAAAISEARRIAESALEDLESGTPWDEVAAEASTNPNATAGGDLGWISEEFNFDEAMLEALFAAEPEEPTEVVEGEDGVFRIGRVTEIIEATVDPDYQSQIADRGVPAEDYRAAIEDDLVAEKLQEKITEQALAEGPQREVAEIFLENTSLPAELPEGSVKVRHILYAPKDDPQGAAQVPEDDPAWATAEEDARVAWKTLGDDISKFDELARAESDEGGADVSGGKLPWFDPASQLDPAFAEAIFTEGLEPGQLLEPVRSSFGWHVVQVMYFPTDVDQANRLRTEIEEGADFATLARDYSYAPEADEGGEIGWVARYQRDRQSEEAIFATEVGSVTEPVVVDGSGVYLYLVKAEETRAPEGEQRDALEESAFTNWYQAQREAFQIERKIEFADPNAGAIGG